MNNCRKLSTYSTEMLKIRSKLYPDSQRVADAIYGQIEMMVDLIVDLNTATECSGHVRPFIMVYKTAPTVTTFYANYTNAAGNLHQALLTIDHGARVIYSPNGRGFSTSPARLEPGELMEVHEILVEIYNQFCEDPYSQNAT